ncbi:MAG TPA: class I tRNA ligase family protein [Streptosporangiaceae bacterium]|nr:class I tRNA ligase family protein [Streptosporangiaceae bacterium]
MTDLPAVERAVAARWTRSGLAPRLLAGPAAGPSWTCYVEPHSTAGLPGATHQRVLALADLYPRFKAMQGFDVTVSHGWACHGLGVEMAVARELGLAGRADVEAYGIEAFTARCRESALRHARAFASLGERLGSLADPNRAYRTMDYGYIESVWWSLRQFFDAKMLFLDRRTAPYCPRCQTLLADHELRGSGVWRPASGTEVIVRLRLDRPPARSQLTGADLLIWTPEPWRLAGNVAVAVHPDETYVIGRRAGHGERVIVAEDAFARALGDGWHIAGRIAGAELAGATYQAVFRQFAHGSHQVLADRSVDVSAGTGVLPLAPAFDARPELSSELPVIDPIGADGRFDRRVPGLNGLLVTDSDTAIVTDLSDRGLLFGARSYVLFRPHCWRCGSRLFDRRTSSWQLRLSGVAARLRACGERVSWRPAGSRPPGGEAGRITDWSVSRTRYWGVPLPIWKCGQGHLTCVSSLTELSELAGRDLLGIDPHRPVIDRVEIACRACGGSAKRVPDILDAAYDVGAMPFAQHGAPMRRRADFDSGGPADLLITSGTQSRSWHYALLAIGSLVLGRTPFLVGLRCGDVLDARGRPMSGRLGNLSEPFPLIDRHGADAVRWFFASATRPDAAIRVTEAAICAVARRVLRKFLNCAMLYAGHAGAAGVAPADRSALDRWLLSELQSTIAEVTAALDAYRPDSGTRRIERFIDDLSTWYVRRSRDRIAGHEGSGAQGTALAVLRTALDVVSRLTAPFAPFLSDYVWNLIRRRDAPDSVHLARWPQVRQALADDRIRRRMLVVRKVVRAGRAARAKAGIGLRQPLARARVGAAEFSVLDDELLALVASELNIKSIEPVEVDGNLGAGERGWVTSRSECLVALDVSVTAELRLEGLARRAIRVIQQARRASGFCPGQEIAVSWQSPDREVEAALSECGQLISQRVRAIKYERALTGGSDAFECTDETLAATFWLRPLLSPLSPGSRALPTCIIPWSPPSGAHMRGRPGSLKATYARVHSDLGGLSPPQ